MKIADLVIAARNWVAGKNPGMQKQSANTVLSRLSRQSNDEAGSSSQTVLSRAPSTKAAYQARIDELFAGDKPRSIQMGQDAALVLDASDILDQLKQGAAPVFLDKSAVHKPQK